MVWGGGDNEYDYDYYLLNDNDDDERRGKLPSNYDFEGVGADYQMIMMMVGQQAEQPPRPFHICLSGKYDFP